MTAKPLIRIVDDDEALTASSAMLLEAMGWDVAVWHSGGAFLDEADLMRPGCLVLDVRMPGRFIAVFQKFTIFFFHVHFFMKIVDSADAAQSFRYMTGSFCNGSPVV